METIDLDLEEANELSFKLKIDGVASGAVSARLYCECADGHMQVFEGRFQGEPETVSFKLPQMGRLVTEGTYPGWIEVLIDNRQFVPANFNLKFKKPVSVQVEGIVSESSKAPKGPTVETVSVVKKVVTETAPATKQMNKGYTKSSLKDWYNKK